MSQPIDLGRTCLCLKVADVDDTAADRVLDLSGKSILIVEDNLEVGEATKALVEFWRADVTWAVNAEEALTLISDGELRPDMVIADYRLPDGDTGIDMLRRIAEVVGPGCHESSSPAIHHRSSPARRAKSARCSCTSRSIPRKSWSVSSGSSTSLDHLELPPTPPEDNGAHHGKQRERQRHSQKHPEGSAI